jgi:hypothetical protein
MSKVVRISDKNYEIIEDMAFRNGVPINAVLDEILEKYISSVPNNDVILVKYRGREVAIR